jgi:hypothetical protein
MGELTHYWIGRRCFVNTGAASYPAAGRGCRQDRDRPGHAVEASVLTSQVWGRQVPLPTLGYAWLEDRSAHQRPANPGLSPGIRR